MQKKVLITLFALLVIILSTVLINLLNTEDSSASVNVQYLSPSEIKNKLPVRIKTWSEELAGVKDAKFSFPVNELFIQIDLKDYIAPKIKSFSLAVDRADRYSLFCIVQTLSSMGLPFVVEKKNKIPTVHVGSDTKESLQKVVDKLMDYDIKSKITEVWL